ncbi:hypothetical protein P5G50_09505 [Leifsonia sp. F6_8S_P_1B]|uniref:Uncharacterized protein n=1 Tax=Leifsonia williamsii TaxID=3035919 RepID=A0ABT8KB76_9MICO|nr:hypothetical protein [Leifsonia williamsii]MDN4614688.1 hypothetical protein [Leifsonia williamsii]
MPFLEVVGTYLKRGLSWATLVATATAAVLGLILVQKQIEAEDNSHRIAAQSKKISTLTADNNSLQDDVEARDKEIDRLKAKLSRVQSSLPAAVDTTEEHAVRATRILELAAEGDAINLNSVDPVLDAGSTDKWSSDAVYYNDRALKFGYGVNYLRLPAETAPSFAACSRSTPYASADSLEPHLLTAANSCLRLASGRFASIQVAAYTEATVKLNVTVWE